ncbi:MAG: cytidine deaminase [Lachnospiraceae bacterium]|nr:cytidine deaminase [Lachnospiraceae bacterium]
MKEYGYLVKCAIDMMKFSYAPYSHFKVGAALLAKNGKVYGGCNIENVAYTPSNCAERTAFFRAIAEGVREFEAIAVVGGKDGVVTEYCAPCGLCRQTMTEFCDPDEFKIIMAASETDYKVYTLAELLPLAFHAEF